VVRSTRPAAADQRADAARRPGQRGPRRARLDGAAGGLLLTVLVGPFISGGEPFANGAGDFFFQVWLYAGFAIGGTLVGYWIAMVFGRDYRSRSLKAYTKTRAAKPRKVVRR
jgi:hypothetical protein